MFVCTVKCCCCCKNVCIVYEWCLARALNEKNFHIDLQRCLLFAMESFSTFI